MRLTLIFALCIFILTNCKDECSKDNVKLGDVRFADQTLLFLDAYSTKTSIFFESNNGEMSEHLINIEESTNPRLCVTVLCRPTYEVDGLNGCEFYDSEDRYYILSAGDLSLHLKAGIEPYIPETEWFYDYVEIGLTEEIDSTLVSSYFAGIVTNSSIEGVVIETSETIITENLSFMVNDTLGGFQNVWVYKNLVDDDEVYMILDQAKGIIQYKYDDKVWTLVE